MIFCKVMVLLSVLFTSFPVPLISGVLGDHLLGGKYINWRPLSQGLRSDLMTKVILDHLMEDVNRALLAYHKL